MPLQEPIKKLLAFFCYSFIKHFYVFGIYVYTNMFATRTSPHTHTQHTQLVAT